MPDELKQELIEKILRAKFPKGWLQVLIGFTKKMIQRRR